MNIIESEESPKEVKVGDWEISLEYGILTSPQNKTVILEPRLAKLMYLLSLNANALVSREYLVQHIWKDTIVNDESLTRAIADLRKTLLKNFSQAINIDTIPKRGYKLTFAPKGKNRVFNLKIKRPLRYAMFGSVLLILTVMWFIGFLKIQVIQV